MKDWEYIKNIRKFYNVDKEETEFEEGYIQFTYCNWTYWGNSVSLVNMLTEEILKDFPSVSTDNIHVVRRTNPPYELTLNITLTLSEIKNIDLSKFEKLPDSFW